MTISHFKAILIRQSNHHFWYQFFPDIINAGDLSGEFCYRADQEQVEITHPVEHTQAQIALAGLTSKLKREIQKTGTAPEVITLIS